MKYVLSAVRSLSVQASCLGGLLWGLALSLPLQAQTAPADQQLQQYWEQATSAVEARSQQALADVQQYASQQEEARRQLREMLGLEPLPERTDLQAKITGEIDEPDYRVQKLHYQALPGLYVTANLYLPKGGEKPCPAILYVCGHSSQRKGDISYGNKVGYQHHGIWFARNGYVCLIIDTVQLGEFKGVHHGTYRMGMWWWNSRGYTPAGVEAWASMRAIDYLQSLEEVDPERIGITGRSGGGAYSWYTAAIDTRVKAAVPVAGITSMRNHIVDNCIEGHCDCMFMVNTYGWDFAELASLIAPRPLLLTNTDKDRIFPLDGVMDVYWKTRHVYHGMNAAGNLGLAISEGPHKDTQRLQVNAFEWFDRFLKETERQADPVEKKYTGPDLQVFTDLPSDERTSKIHDTFVPIATPSAPESVDQWEQLQQTWKAELKRQSFRGWPEQNVAPTIRAAKLPMEAIPANLRDGTDSPPVPPDFTAVKSLVVQFELTTQGPFVLPLWYRTPTAQSKSADGQPRQVTLRLIAEPVAEVDVAAAEPVFLFAPRGLGDNAWSGDEKKQTHIRRRFALLGCSLDAWRVWDILQAARAIRTLPDYKDCELTIEAEGDLAGMAVYAALFEPGIKRLKLSKLPESHQQGPEFLNVLRILDLPQAVAMAAETSIIQLQHTPEDVTEFARIIAELPGHTPTPIELLAD